MTDDQEKRDTADAVAAALTGKKRLEQKALDCLQNSKLSAWLNGEIIGVPKATQPRAQIALQVRHNQLLEQQNKLLAELVAVLKDRR